MEVGGWDLGFRIWDLHHNIHHLLDDLRATGRFDFAAAHFAEEVIAHLIETRLDRARNRAAHAPQFLFLQQTLEHAVLDRRAEIEQTLVQARPPLVIRYIVRHHDEFLLIALPDLSGFRKPDRSHSESAMPPIIVE